MKYTIILITSILSFPIGDQVPSTSHTNAQIENIKNGLSVEELLDLLAHRVDENSPTQQTNQNEKSHTLGQVNEQASNPGIQSDNGPFHGPVMNNQMNLPGIQNGNDQFLAPNQQVQPPQVISQ